jgi:polyisoprenoid-binding protein YceI
MSRRALNIIGILILMGITAAITIFAYTYLVGGSGEPTAPLIAPTLDLSTATPNLLETQVAELQATNAALSTVVAGGSEATAEATNDSASEMTAEATTSTSAMAETTAEATTSSTTTTETTAEATAESTADATSEAVAAAEAAAAIQAAGAAQVAAAGTLYRIDSADSQVSFTLTEELRGTPTTVVGTTDQVAGDIFVDFTTPANSKVGVIRINARTLVTDQENRNRALRSNILQSSREEYQFIEFTPTSITELPDNAEMGSTIKFKVTGDLKIRNIVQPVTFDVSVTAGADSLTGSATAQVTRDQFNLQIPNAPGVANVSNDVTLDIQFTAPKVNP